MSESSEPIEEGVEEDVLLEGQESSETSESSEPTLEEQLQERTNDLQRLQAEYVNYKRRVDREREAAREIGIDSVLRSLLNVLDDLDRAEVHGELDGGFKAVADSVRQIAKQFGMDKFAEPGEPFDPNLHEAVTHSGQSEDVNVTSLDTVFVSGYRVGDRILRPATVAVIDPVE